MSQPDPNAQPPWPVPGPVAPQPGYPPHPQYTAGGHPHIPPGIGPVPPPYPSHPPYPPSYPPPPKRMNPWLTAALVVLGVLVLGSAARVAGRLADSPESPGRSSATSIPSIDLDATNRFFARLNESGVTDHSRAGEDGKAACAMLARGDTVADAIAGVRRLSSASESDFEPSIIVVAGVQELCPQNSPFTLPKSEPEQALPSGRDGEFITRLRRVGISSSDNEQATSLGRTTCDRIAEAGGDVNAVVQAMVEVNPGKDPAGPLFATVIAQQVYCPVS